MKTMRLVALGLLSAMVVGRGHGYPANQTAERTRAQRPDPRAVIFVRRGCTDCHAISALGVKASRDIGPDLTFAYADVVNRYGVNLQSFLADPNGVMRLVLASHPRLTVVDRDSMVQVLARLYQERRADLSPAPSRERRETHHVAGRLPPAL